MDGMYGVPLSFAASNHFSLQEEEQKKDGEGCSVPH